MVGGGDGEEQENGNVESSYRPCFCLKREYQYEVLFFFLFLYLCVNKSGSLNDLFLIKT